MYVYFKRIFDIVLSFVGVIILCLPLIFILIILFINNKGAPFFVQERIGKNNKVFKMIKLKSMNDKRDEYGYLLPDSDRLTFFGSFLRRSSIDEIPQLINVIKGDMSLVGPRPLLTEYLLLYNEEQKRRHNVKPGITGWAQINGRNNVFWQDKFKMDLWYIDNISFKLDVKILLNTIYKVLRCEDVNTPSNAKMTKFTTN